MYKCVLFLNTFLTSIRKIDGIELWKVSTQNFNLGKSLYDKVSVLPSHQRTKMVILLPFCGVLWFRSKRYRIFLQIRSSFPKSLFCLINFLFSCDEQLKKWRCHSVRVFVCPFFFLLVSLKFLLVLKSFNGVSRQFKQCLKFNGSFKAVSRKF